MIRRYLKLLTYELDRGVILEKILIVFEQDNPVFVEEITCISLEIVLNYFEQEPSYNESVPQVALGRLFLEEKKD